MRIIAFVAVLLATPVSSPALVDNSTDFVAVCRDNDPVCIGYLKGFLDGHWAAEAGLRYCLTDSVTLGELKAALELRASRDPKMNSYGTVTALSAVLAKDYPCK